MLQISCKQKLWAVFVMAMAAYIHIHRYPLQPVLRSSKDCYDLIKKSFMLIALSFVYGRLQNLSILKV